MTNKSFCEDLTEGKFSFPIVHCIHVTAGHDTRLLHILRQRTEDVDMKRHALLWMEQAVSAKLRKLFLLIFFFFVE